MSIKDIFEINKLPSVFFLVIAVVGTFVFYGGDSVLIKADPKTPVGFYSYIIWLFGCGILITNIIKYIIKKIHAYTFKIKLNKEYRKTLENLYPVEVCVIREFIYQKRHALDFPLNNPVITGLISKEVILINSSLGSKSFIVNQGKTTFVMNKYMLSIINKNDYFGLKEMSDEQIDESRPDFLD
jgi:hypothetical protein